MKASVTLLLLLTFVSPSWAADAGPQPKIEIPRIRYDIGKIFEQPQYEYAFTVRNRGKADLIIDKVQPGCGCTAAKFDSLIAPGSEGKIWLVVDGNKVHGEFEKTATVHSNDPVHSVMTLYIAGNERPYVNVTPAGRIYLMGHFDEPVEKKVTLSSNEEGLDFKVSGVTSDVDEQITYDVTPGDAHGEYVLTVRKNPKLPTNTTYGAIYVHTNSEHSPEVGIPVQVVTKGAITVQPEMVNFGRVKFTENGTNASPVTRSVILLKTSGEFAVEDVSVDNEHFVASLKETVPGKRFEVSVTFQPPVKSKVSQREVGELHIRTNDPGEPSITVRMVARAL